MSSIFADFKNIQSLYLDDESICRESSSDSEIILKLSTVKTLYGRFWKSYGHDDLSAFGKGLQYLTSLQKMSIHLEQIPSSDAEQIRDGMKYLQNLKKFALSGVRCGLDAGQVGIILDSLIETRMLTHLKINFTFCFEMKDAVSLKRLLQNKSHSLTTLDLDINTNELNVLEVILKGLTYPTQLKALRINIMHDSLGVEGAKIVAQALQRLQSLEDLSLCIFQNSHIGRKGAEQIGVALKQLVNLTSMSIEIGYLNDLKTLGMKKLCSGFNCLKNLTQLDIDIGEENINIHGVEQLFLQLNHLENLDSLALHLRVGKEDNGTRDWNDEGDEDYDEEVNETLLELFSQQLPRLKKLKTFNYTQQLGYIGFTLTDQQKSAIIRSLPYLVSYSDLSDERRKRLKNSRKYE